MPIYLKLAIGWMIIVIGLATWNNPIGMLFFMFGVFTIAAILAICYTRCAIGRIRDYKF